MNSQSILLPCSFFDRLQATVLNRFHRPGPTTARQAFVAEYLIDLNGT
jgi:hypothetical protein